MADDKTVRVERVLKAVQNLRTRKDQADGRLAELMKRLKEEFGVTSIDAARKLYAKEKSDLEKREPVLEAALKQLEQDVAAVERSS